MNIAEWLREQPHDRYIMFRCVDVCSGDEPSHPAPQPTVDVTARTRVDGRLASVMVRAPDEIFAEPDYLQRLLASEIETAAERLKGQA